VQQEITIKPSHVNFFGSLGRALGTSRLFVAFGSELSHAAFSFSAGSFSLAGIHLEEILGVGLQVLQMDAVILGFCLLIVRVARLRGLIQIVGVGSVAYNAAASGVGGPAMTAQVGPVPSTRGPSVILTACAFGACFGAAVAETAKAAVKTMIVNSFFKFNTPIQNRIKMLSGSMRSLKLKFSHIWPLKKFLCLQLLSCLCYTQKHAQLDARAHEAP